MIKKKIKLKKNKYIYIKIDNSEIKTSYKFFYFILKLIMWMNFNFLMFYNIQYFEFNILSYILDVAKPKNKNPIRTNVKDTNT
jgi:hypothetical protein